MNIVWTQVEGTLSRPLTNLWTSPNPGLPQTGQLNAFTRSPSGWVTGPYSVVETPNVSQGNPGEAGFAAVSFLLQQGNVAALKWRIRQELQGIDRQVRCVMANHRYGGVLAVADIQVSFAPANAIQVRGVLPGGAPYYYDQPVRNYGPESRSFGGLWFERGVYAQPEHAISVYRTKQRSHGEIRAAGGTNSHNEQLFFWGVWDGN